MMKAYTPADWYWCVGDDETRVFSSKANAFLPITDETFVAWDGTPTRIDTFDNLRQVLKTAGVPPYATVTPRQARLALLGAGLLDRVETAVNAAGGSTKITWDYATEINRNDPMIATLGASLGLTDAALDFLFKKASEIQ